MLEDDGVGRKDSTGLRAPFDGLGPRVADCFLWL